MTQQTLRRTKIVATIGPSSSSDAMLSRLIDAGVNVFRLNFSHGALDQHVAVAERIRALSEQADIHTGILADLQGPKIRIGAFRDGGVGLATGA